MRWFSILMLLGMLSGGAVLYHLHERTAPAICVRFQDGVGGGAVYVPAVDNFVSGEGTSAYNGSQERYRMECSYRMVSFRNRLTVLAHYVIERNGVLLELDRKLPVWDGKPDQANWSKLDSQIIACAYTTGNTTHY